MTRYRIYKPNRIEVTDALELTIPSGARFAHAVLDGSKTHTIRAKRKAPPRVGEILHCYTGLRTKKVKLLGRFQCGRDGFANPAYAWKWWLPALPFTGHLIHWSPKEAAYSHTDAMRIRRSSIRGGYVQPKDSA